MNSSMGIEARITFEDIFQTACDLPPAEREAYLNEACAGDTALRHEVEELLDYYETNRTFLEKPAIQDLAQEMAQAKAPPNSAVQMIGRQIGNYRILAMIGKGGMGEVYLAHDNEFDIDVAIKFLPEIYASDPEWQARFNREGRLNFELTHENIAALRHKGEDQGRPFLVFEYIRGATLEDRLDKGGPLPVKEALPLFSQLATALSCAHSRNIIHRDLKPANLKITPDGQLKVLDFGIAKRITTDLATVDLGTLAPGDQQTRDFGETRQGEVIGTVAYMSPEQTRGQTLDAGTDLWSCGVVMYQALTGKLPFKGVDTYDTLNLIRDQKHEPDWSALPAETPKPIQKLLRQCFVKDRARRLPSAAEIHETIEQELNPTVKRWKRIALGAVAMLAIALPVIIWLWISRQSQPTYLAVLPFKESGALQVKVGDGLAKSVRDSLATIPNLTVLPYSGSNETNALNTAPDVLLKAMGVSWLLSGEVEHRGDEVEVRYRLHNSKFPQPLEGVVQSSRRDYSRLQGELANRVSAALNTVSPKNAKSVKFTDQEKYLTALTLLQNDLNEETIDQPIKLLEELAQTEPEPARVQAILSRAYLQKASLTSSDIKSWVIKAIKASEDAVRLDANAHEVKVTNGMMLAFQAKTKEDRANAIGVLKAAWEDGTEDVNAALELARTYEENKQDVEAENVYRNVVRKWPGYWVGHNELSAFFMARGRFKEALAETNFVLRIDSNNLSAAINLGIIQFELGEYEPSEQTFRRLFENRQDLSSSDRIKILIGIGISQFFQERFVEASETFKRAVELDTDSQEPHLLGYLGDALSEIRGEAKSASDAYSKAIDIFRATPLQPDDTARLAELFAKRSKSPIADQEQAAKDRQRALNAMNEILNPNAEKIELEPDSLYSVLKVYLYLDDLPNAVAYAQKALDANVSFAKLENDPQLKRLRQESAYQQIGARARGKP